MFRAFDIPYVLGGPGGAPDGTTDVLSLVIYREAFGLGGIVGSRLSAGVRGGGGCGDVRLPDRGRQHPGDLSPAP